MNQITVKELKELCEKEILIGNGDKKIVISKDNEGNGFHGLFYGFTYYDEDEHKDLIYDSEVNSEEDTIILG